MPERPGQNGRLWSAEHSGNKADRVERIPTNPVRLMVAWFESSPAILLSANVATSFVSDLALHHPDLQRVHGTGALRETLSAHQSRFQLPAQWSFSSSGFLISFHPSPHATYGMLCALSAEHEQHDRCTPSIRASRPKADPASPD